MITITFINSEKAKDSEKEVKAEEKSEESAMEVESGEVKEEEKEAGEDAGAYKLKYFGIKLSFFLYNT